MQNELSKTVISDLKELGETVGRASIDGMLFEMRAEFLSIAFSELIQSDIWNSYDKSRKQDLFMLYEELNLLLTSLDTFASKYPDAEYGTFQDEALKFPN